MAEDDYDPDFEDVTMEEEDAILSAITPRKVNLRWGLASLVLQFAAQTIGAAADCADSISLLITQRYLYENARATQAGWEQDTAKEIEAFKGFYLVPDTPVAGVEEEKAVGED